ncbi:MAG: MBL fold metallo-hydrolase [Acidobacteria bacterium]|nr:MBL fold metallo-hydrolase [Acidobacteriota bacterium]
MAKRVFAFDRNDPYDRASKVELVIPALLDSKQYMKSIREFVVPEGGLALWYLGQNGFILKSSTGPLIGIDLYLSNSCARKFGHLPFRLDRQLPIFIEPEDLDLDVFIATHSHDDHADPETIRRLPKHDRTAFFGPADACRIFLECGVDRSRCTLIHPGESVALGEKLLLTPSFAMPTDGTDLNHIGIAIVFPNGIKFYDTGDTAYSDLLGQLLPKNVDVCAICINGGFHNLSAMQAAAIVNAIRPRVTIPCHYDMMVNNVACPEMLKVALDVLEVDTEFVLMNYYEPWVYQRKDMSASCETSQI